MAQKIINTRLQIRNDTAAHWESENPVLLKGEMGFETDTRKMKFGDGTSTWSQLQYAGADAVQIQNLIDAAEDDVKVVVPNDGETDAEACSRIYNNEESKGDMCIVKSVITGEKYSYTAYVYNGTSWEAMDGNYNAENVYFAEDLTYTKAIGELPAVGSSGSATLSAAGKNVKEVLASILAQKKQPADPTQPAVSLSGTQSSESLEVGSTVNKSGTMTASLSAGSYTYGPATGITASAWETEVTYSGDGEPDTGTSNSLPYAYNFTLGESAVNVTFKATATHGAGSVAKDNLGGASSPTKQIAAGNKNKTVTATYTPFRNFFYGVDNTTGEINSALIRSLTKGGAAAAKTLPELAASSKASASRVIVAIPADSSIGVTKVLMPSAMNADATSNFVKQTNTVNVAGANGTDYMKAYNVWVYQPASIDASETYSITLG